MSRISLRAIKKETLELILRILLKNSRDVNVKEAIVEGTKNKRKK